MSLQKKYYYYFKDINNITNTVELWQNTTDILTPVLITGSVNPFSIELPTLNTKFQSVRGTGCECNIICKNNMEFFSGLYHTDAQEFIIKHYVADNINWIGYMNSELMRESYSELNNYEVNFNGSDGFALMERLKFVDDTKAKYTGIKSQLEIIRLIFLKIGLPFSELKVCLSTTFSGQTGTTILSETYLDCANFYDEDGEAETLRKVLEGILDPYGAMIFQLKGNIIITDINNIATNSGFTFNKYLMSNTNWTITGTEAITGNTIELNTIGYTGTGADIENSGGKNKQTIKYSPYPIKEIVNESLKATTEFNTLDYSFVAKKGYWYKQCYSSENWDITYAEVTKYTKDTVTSYSILSAFPTYGDEKVTYVATDTSYHYRWNGLIYSKVDSTTVYGADDNVHAVIEQQINNTVRVTNKVKPIVVLPKSNYAGTSDIKVVKGAGILISGKIGAITDYGRYLTNIKPALKLRIGSYYFNGVTWTTTNTVFHPRISKPDESRFDVEYNGTNIVRDIEMITMGNKGASGIFIPINIDLSGELELNFCTGFKTDDKAQYYLNTDILELWINNLSLNIVQEDGTKISDSDIEFIGNLDSNFKDEAEKVNLICGTESSISDRGKLLYLDGVYKPIKIWNRAGKSAKIEELLLNSLSSNFKAGFYSLNNLDLKNNFNALNILKDTTFLSNRKFMVSGYNINYEDASINCSITEISADVNNLI